MPNMPNPSRPAGSNAPEEDGPHGFEPRDADDATRYGLPVDGCDYCGQVAVDPIHQLILTTDDATVPLADATGDLRALLVDLAVRYEDDHRRPCCDGETTLADWLGTDLPIAELSDQYRRQVAVALHLPTD